MHPEVRSDKPGNCPKCGMNLGLAKPAADSSWKVADMHKDQSGHEGINQDIHAAIKKAKQTLVP
jgi:hypothetical protein